MGETTVQSASYPTRKLWRPRHHVTICLDEGEESRLYGSLPAVPSLLRLCLTHVYCMEAKEQKAESVGVFADAYSVSFVLGHNGVVAIL